LRWNKQPLFKRQEIKRTAVSTAETSMWSQEHVLCHGDGEKDFLGLKEACMMCLYITGFG